MNSFAKLTAAICIAAMNVGCVNSDGNIDKQTIVGLGGAAAGGILGSNVGRGSGRTAAIIGGTLLGALAGSEVGKSLDRTDLMYNQRTQNQALENNRVGVTSSWKNPDTGAAGYITPTNTFNEGGRYCREYTQTVVVANKTQKAYGKACRMPDGSWEIVS